MYSPRGYDGYFSRAADEMRLSLRRNSRSPTTLRCHIPRLFPVTSEMQPVAKDKYKAWISSYYFLKHHNILDRYLIISSLKPFKRFLYVFQVFLKICNHRIVGIMTGSLIHISLYIYYHIPALFLFWARYLQNACFNYKTPHASTRGLFQHFIDAFIGEQRFRALQARQRGEWASSITWKTTRCRMSNTSQSQYIILTISNLFDWFI